MLIDRGITEGEVVTLKLTSGEELIGKLAEDSQLQMTCWLQHDNSLKKFVFLPR